MGNQIHGKSWKIEEFGLCGFQNHKQDLNLIPAGKTSVILYAVLLREGKDQQRKKFQPYDALSLGPYLY